MMMMTNIACLPFQYCNRLYWLYVIEYWLHNICEIRYSDFKQEKWFRHFYCRTCGNFFFPFFLLLIFLYIITHFFTLRAWREEIDLTGLKIELNCVISICCRAAINFTIDVAKIFSLTLPPLLWLFFSSYSLFML